MVRIVKKSLGLGLFLLGIIFLVSCSSTPEPPSLDVPETQPAAAISINEDIPPTQIPSADTPDSIFADVLSVDVSGSETAYQFLVEIYSPDTGCEQYADWWEVVSEDGDLIYRRILTHSHVSEQPFKRSGGPVAIDADTLVIVRAHMNSHGYGGMALRGSAASGFTAIQLEPGFAATLEQVDPLPSGCGF